MRHQLGIALTLFRLNSLLQLRLGGLHNIGNLVVSQPAMRVNDRLVKLVACHLTQCRDFHLAHHRQSIDFRFERAQPVRQLFRQHWHHMPREIHRRRAINRLFIERALGLNIVRHVRYRHIQRPVPALVLASINRVVEVFCVFTVYRDKRDSPHVLAANEIGLNYLFDKASNLLLNRLRPFVRNVVAAKCYVYFQTRRAAVAQHLGNARDRLSAPRWVFHNLCHHKVAIFGIARALVRNQYFVRDALAVWHHDPKALLVVIAAHDLRKAALQNLDNRAFFAASIIDTGHARQHLIAIEQRFHLARTQKQVLRTVFWNEEPKAVFVALNATLDQLHARRKAIHTAAIANDLPVATHRDQPPAQRFDLLVGDEL